MPKPSFNHNEVDINSEENYANYNTPKRANPHPPVVHGTPALNSPPKTYFGLLPGSLRGTFLGNREGRSLGFQVLKIERDESLKCYSAIIARLVQSQDC